MMRRPAFIAGASSGIGAATAQVLAVGGYPVALGARRAGICEQLAAKITADGGEAFAAPLDVANDDSVTSFVEAAASALGTPEILVTSAGAVELQRTHEASTAEFAAQVQLHLLGVHRLVDAMVPGMVSRQRGDIVFISSDVVTRPRPNMGMDWDHETLTALFDE